MSYPNQKTQDALEALIDQIGLENVIDQISTICLEKAEHIRSTYIDTTALPDHWEYLSKEVEKLRVKISS